MKNAIAKTCAYAMLASLIVFGLAGISIQYADLFRRSFPSFDPAWAETALVPSLMIAFVATSLASMLSVEDAERAIRAGKGYAKAAIVAGVYAVFCIVIEVGLAHYGAERLGLQIDTLWLVVALTFFALAPRMLAFVKSAMAGLDEANAKADAEVEHKRVIEEAKAKTEAAEARMEAGRRRFGVIEGAAVSLAAMGLAAHDQASALDPAPLVQTLDETASAEDPEIEFIGERFKARDQAAFDRVMTLRLDGQFNPRQIALRVKAEGHDVSQATVYRWVNAIDREAARDVPLGTMA